MIGYLEGRVVFSDGKKLILQTSSGVGYEVNFAYFATVGESSEIFIHHHISENDQSLWGFKNIEDKKMFELLKSVNKVGSSKAYPLVTQVGVSNLISAIVFEQKDVLTQAQGIGKKMAEQIILSLKDKVEKFQSFKAQDIAKASPESNSEALIDKGIFQETMQALESLGYKDKNLAGLVNRQYTEEVKTSEELIKLVLREL